MDSVIRVQRSDQDDGNGFVLVRVIRVHAAKTDCQVMGTDGNAAFETRLDGARISTLKAGKFEGTDEEWAGVVQRLLFRDDTSNDISTNVELVAQVSGSRLSLIVRQRLEGGITPRLGTIHLQRNEQLEDNIELFEWAGLAASTARSSELGQVTLRDQLKERALECNRLRDQLQDLVEARKEHEQMLLGKFRLLLNAKKMKIRDQQRLLAGAKIDAKAVAKQTEAAGTKARGHHPSPSRSAKRRADAGNMDVDEDADASIHDEDEMQIVTPKSTDVDSDEEELASAPPPPRRELPFGSSRRAAAQQAAPLASAARAQSLDDNDETDDDDEL